MDGFLKESIFTSAISDVVMVHIVALLLHLHLDLLRVLDVNDLWMFYQLWMRQVPEDIFLQLRRFLIVINYAHRNSEDEIMNI